MTYSTSIPNAGQSPGLFPAQANTNFLRLKDIINNDHNFTDTTSASQGVHNQVTMIDRAAPVGLPAGTNGILFSEDVSGASQLRYYNGSDTYELTPNNASPLKITGSVALAGNATSGTIYTLPNNTHGTIFVNYISPAGNFYRYYMFYKSGAAFIEKIVLSSSNNSSRPAISFSGSNLRVVNGNSSARTVGYYIIVESIDP